MAWNWTHIWDRLPVYLSAAGTAALAGIGFITLDPLIENLKLRDRNQALSEENRQLAAQIENRTNNLDEVNKELSDALQEKRRIESGENIAEPPRLPDE